MGNGMNEMKREKAENRKALNEEQRGREWNSWIQEAELLRKEKGEQRIGWGEEIRKEKKEEWKE